MPDFNFIFTRKHAFYASNETIWRRSLLAYSGGAKYLSTALIKHISEIELEFQERQNRAYYFNYPRKIARMITQYVLSQQPNREGADDELVEDWSRTGLRTNEVMRQFSTMLNVYGTAWLLVDMPSFTGEKTKEQEQRERLRPYALALSPLNVVDWSYGADGKFDWVLTEEFSIDSSDPYSASTKTLRRKLWTRDKVSSFCRRETEEVKLESEISHGLGVVPFVRHEEVDGYGIATNHWFEDVVRISDAILNNESEAQMNTVKQMFGLLVVSEDFATSAPKKPTPVLDEETGEVINSPDSLSQVIARSAAVWESSEEKGTTRYVSPSGASTATIRTENQSLRKELFDVIGLAVQKDSKMVESAEAKMWDFQNIEQFMRTRADALEQCEFQAWNFMKLWKPSVRVPGVSYNRNFAVLELKESIAALLDLSSINLDSQEYQKEVAKTAVSLLNRLRQLPQDIQDSINKDIENSDPSLALDFGKAITEAETKD
jgi:uncharacterized protein (DUF2132 family)